MKKSIITLLIALASISAFGRTVEKSYARQYAEAYYFEMEGLMDIEDIYAVMCPHYSQFSYPLSSYNPIILKEAFNRVKTSERPLLFSIIYDQVNYEMDYPNDTIKREKIEEKEIFGSTDLNAGKAYKRLNENYNGVSEISSIFPQKRTQYWDGEDLIYFDYKTTVDEIPFTTIQVGSNKYLITYYGLEKDWSKYEEKINELIKVITTL